MTGLQLTLLGRFTVSLDDRPAIKFRTKRAQALLAYLVTEETTGNVSHRREALMELLWPGLPPQSARSNLRQTIYYLRQAIVDLSVDGGKEKIPFLITDRNTARVNPVYPLQADVLDFDQILNGAEDGWSEAIDLYQGDFLADFYIPDANTFEEWAGSRRAAYRRQFLAALETLTSQKLGLGEYDEAERYALRQLEIDSLRENAYRQLMEALALSGYREEALSVYENCRRLLAEELSMEPASRTTQIAEKIQAGDPIFDTPLAQGVRGYELKEEIGAGAFGTIHRAYQSAIDREVAVKVIRRRYANDPEFIRRFEDEAQTVARLEHPYIVPLYDYWRDPDGAYLVMRYLNVFDTLNQRHKHRIRS